MIIPFHDMKIINKKEHKKSLKTSSNLYLNVFIFMLINFCHMILLISFLFLFFFLIIIFFMNNYE